MSIIFFNLELWGYYSLSLFFDISQKRYFFMQMTGNRHLDFLLKKWILLLIHGGLGVKSALLGHSEEKCRRFIDYGEFE